MRSGQTTRAIGGLHKDWTGTVRLGDQELAHGSRQRTAEQRQRVQYIFQNPYQSLNPKRTVEQILRRPLELLGIAKGRAAKERARSLL